MDWKHQTLKSQLYKELKTFMKSVNRIYCSIGTHTRTLVSICIVFIICMNVRYVAGHSWTGCVTPLTGYIVSMTGYVDTVDRVCYPSDWYIVSMMGYVDTVDRVCYPSDWVYSLYDGLCGHSGQGVLPI